MISVVSPVHNEARNLDEFISRIRKVMKSLGLKWELILVNDASTDGSAEILRKWSLKDKRVVVFSHRRCMGQTGSFRTGFNNARGSMVITMDADLQVLPEDIPLFARKIESGYDVVNGIRENRQHPFWMKLASRFYNILMLVFFRSPVFDAASNFTAFRTRYVKGLPLRDNDHRYIIPIAMRRGAARIGEVIVAHHARKHGKSKYTALPKYLRGFPELFVAWLRIRSGKYDFR